MKSWQEFVSGVKYKPNFKIEFVREVGEREAVRFEMYVPDVNKPSRNIPVSLTRLLPRRRDFESDEIAESYFQKWIQFALRDLEFHEIDEWLTFDGVKVFDPHA